MINSPANAPQAPNIIYAKDYVVPNYLIDTVDLTFDLNADFTTVTATLAINKNPVSQSQSKNLLLDGDELILVGIKLNGQELTAEKYTLTPTHLMLTDVPDKFQLEIVTKIFPDKNTALSGLYLSRQTYCTQCEAEGFRRITYFMDHPDVLARFTTTVIANKKTYPYLLSNGNLIATGESENDRHWAKWEDPFRKPSYLFALVAGDFDLLEDNFLTHSKHNVNIKIYVEKGYGDQSQHAMYSVKEAMRWDEQAFGREYDLDIYMIVAIGDFNMGAMENKGLNIFNTKYILAKPDTATDENYIYILSVIGHEYFHNWSGNRVTCRDWFQLSLKEGFTIFRDQSFTQDLISKSVMRIKEVTDLREHQFPEDAGPLAHPVRPDSYIEINNFYTSTIYNKGAEVLRMLQTIVTPKTFRQGTDLYFQRFDGQAVTIEDFVQTMEEVSGKDLAQFRLWYSQAGTPVVTVEDDYDPNEKMYTLRINQTIPPTPQQANKSPMYIPIKIALLNQAGQAFALEAGDGTKQHELVLHLQSAAEIFKFKDIPTRPCPSLLRDFSAPIKLKYAYADQELQFLFKHDSDAFNRFEAGQQYALHILMQLIRTHRQGANLQLPDDAADMYAYVLAHDLNDPYLLSMLLTIPSEKYIGEQMEIVDVDGIHAARRFMVQWLAEKLESEFLKTYHEHHQDDKPYRFDMKDIARRQLKNKCLAYLMHLPKHYVLGIKQFNAAIGKNMTDTQAALAAINHIDFTERETCMDLFYKTYQHDALVVDKWLSLQATTELPTALAQIKKLMLHGAFDLKNPNKVYALIGAFAQSNPVAFHAETGEGYAFLAETVKQLDKINPQIAARMVKPLTTWHRYDKERQAYMTTQLRALLDDKKISSDLYELVFKSLNS